jgi:hypothetical protein
MQTPTVHPEAARLMREWGTSVQSFAEHFLPERFPRPFDPPHTQIFSILDNDKIQHAVVMAPRGSGKTSLVKAWMMQRALFGVSRNIVFVAASMDLAVQQTEDLKRIFDENKILGRVFGPQKSKEWAQERWVMKNGCIVQPRGAGQVMRGLLHGSDRPDLMVFDDLENEEAVKNDLLREAMVDWFFGTAMNMFDNSRSDFRALVTGTMLHFDSLLARLMEDPDWNGLQLAIHDDDGRPLFPNYMDTEKIMKKRDGLQRQGLLHRFYLEFCNLPVGGSDQTFKKEMFITQEPTPQEAATLEYWVVVDPAKTKERTSCDHAIVTVGIQWVGQKIFARELICKQMHCEDLFSCIANQAAKYGCTSIGVEVTGLGDWITRPLGDFLRQRHIYAKLIELHAKGEKDDRIEGLASYYHQKQIFHGIGFGKLENQLLAFPRSRRKDAADAMAYVVQMLGMRGGWFSAAPRDPLEERRALDNYYGRIEKQEEPALARWRWA